MYMKCLKHLPSIVIYNMDFLIAVNKSLVSFVLFSNVD